MRQWSVVLEALKRNGCQIWIRTYEAAQTDILDYIRYYNFKRAHSYNNYLNPVMAEKKAIA